MEFFLYGFLQNTERLWEIHLLQFQKIPVRFSLKLSIKFVMIEVLVWGTKIGNGNFISFIVFILSYALNQVYLKWKLNAEGIAHVVEFWLFYFSLLPHFPPSLNCVPSFAQLNAQINFILMYFGLRILRLSFRSLEGWIPVVQTGFFFKIWFPCCKFAENFI